MGQGKFNPIAFKINRVIEFFALDLVLKQIVEAFV